MAPHGSDGTKTRRYQTPTKFQAMEHRASGNPERVPVRQPAIDKPMVCVGERLLRGRNPRVSSRVVIGPLRSQDPRPAYPRPTCGVIVISKGVDERIGTPMPEAAPLAEEEVPLGHHPRPELPKLKELRSYFQRIKSEDLGSKPCLQRSSRGESPKEMRDPVKGGGQPELAGGKARVDLERPPPDAEATQEPLSRENTPEIDPLKCLSPEAHPGRGVGPVSKRESTPTLSRLSSGREPRKCEKRIMVRACSCAVTSFRNLDWKESLFVSQRATSSWSLSTKSCPRPPIGVVVVSRSRSATTKESM